jgi:hypothetical protein
MYLSRGCCQLSPPCGSAFMNLGIYDGAVMCCSWLALPAALQPLTHCVYGRHPPACNTLLAHPLQAAPCVVRLAIAEHIPARQAGRQVGSSVALVWYMHVVAPQTFAAAVQAWQHGRSTLKPASRTRAARATGA